MEWNEKYPFSWDWEHHNLFSGSELELGNNSSKRLVETVKDMQPNEQNKTKDVTREIGLKLGKRTYFEDVCAGNNNMTKNSNSSTKKNRASQLSNANYWCQVEGCNVDLSGAKDYHRKHRVCDVHSKCSKVVVAGQERRFCQQCSRFHGLLEFDHKKRSCRKRLSDHNARRRKPQEETISFNTPSYCSPFCVDREQVGFLVNGAPFSITKQNVSSRWNNSCGFSLTHSKGSWISKPVKLEKNVEHIQFSDSRTSNLIPPLALDMDKLVHFKNPAQEILGQGIEASVSASNFDRGALSLLSTEFGAVNTNHNNDLNGYWTYQRTQPLETHSQQTCVVPFQPHKSNSAAQFEAPLFRPNHIL